MTEMNEPKEVLEVAGTLQALIEFASWADEERFKVIFGLPTGERLWAKFRRKGFDLIDVVRFLDRGNLIRMAVEIERIKNVLSRCPTENLFDWKEK